MRNTRIVAALAALLMTAALPLLSGGNATAATSVTKVHHSLVVMGKETSKNHFIAKGHVSTYEGRKITVQLNANKSGWKAYSQVLTSSADGSFRTKITAGKRDGDKYCYRVIVPATAKYKTTKGNVGCITTTRV